MLRLNEAPAKGQRRFVTGVIDKKGAAKDRTFSFVFNSGGNDRYGDTIEVKGWQLANFKRNPIALFNHMHSAPIGTVPKIVKGKVLHGDIKLAERDVSETAGMVHDLIEADILRATSVGFMPLEWERKTDKDGRFEGYHFKKSELWEVSVVSVPADPAALAQARSMGINVSPLVDIYEEMLDADPKDTSLIVERDAVEAAYKAITNRPQPTPQAKFQLGPDGILRAFNNDTGDFIGHMKDDGTLWVDEAYRSQIAACNLAKLIEARKADKAGPEPEAETPAVDEKAAVQPATIRETPKEKAPSKPELAAEDKTVEKAPISVLRMSAELRLRLINETMRH